jgi:hypothetical protein
MIRDSVLRPNEKLIMLALLDRADNDTCEIPAWRSPSLLAVQKDTSLARSTVAKTVAHLEMHGWLSREGQKAGQKPGTRHSGSGRSATRWTILPADFALPCKCGKPDRPSRGPSGVETVREADHLDSPSEDDVFAGQDADCTKGGRDEGEQGGWAWPGGSYGENPDGG